MPDRDSVFVSYRRSDAAASATALRQTLVERFGEDAVFQDVVDIPLGEKFPDVLSEGLARAAVVLAVIGKGWLSATDEWSQRRIDFPDDWVRKELSTALGDPEVTVIPVLVDDAAMPPTKALPSALQALTARHAVTLRHDTWDATTRPLTDRIAKKVAPSSEATPVESSTPAMTPQIMRQALIEALESMNQPGAQVLLTTVDQVSQIIPSQDSASLTPERKTTLERMLRRIIGRPFIQVSDYAEQIFDHEFTAGTTNRRWVGYSLEAVRSEPMEISYRGCLLLSPDENGNVTGAVIAGNLDRDASWARDNGGYDSWSRGPLLVEVGTTFGTLRS
jgi:hypothetical protein